MSTHGGPYDVITQEGFVEAGPDAADAAAAGGTILDSGQANACVLGRQDMCRVFV